MTEVQMARVPVQVICEPQQWESIRQYAFDNRLIMGRFIADAILFYIDQKKAKK